jgi:hypothetical protein
MKLVCGQLALDISSLKLMQKGMRTNLDWDLMKFGTRTQHGDIVCILPRAKLPVCLRTTNVPGDLSGQLVFKYVGHSGFPRTRDGDALAHDLLGIILEDILQSEDKTSMLYGAASSPYHVRDSKWRSERNFGSGEPEPTKKA